MNALARIRARLRCLAWRTALRIADGESVEGSAESADLVFHFGRITREEFESLPSLLSRSLAFETSPTAVEILLERELNNALMRAAHRAELLHDRKERVSE